MTRTALLPADGDVPSARSAFAEMGKERGQGPWAMAWRRFRRNRLALISLLVVATLVALALVVPLVSPYDITTTDFTSVYANPSAKHWLGTDGLGRDTAVRLFFALRVSMAVALLVEVTTLVLGASFGLLAGYLGGAIDFVLSRVVDLTLAFPSLLLAILVTGIFGQWSFVHFGPLGRFLLVAASLAVVNWTLLARYVRAEALSLRARPFVEAARCAGSGNGKILLRHILPNIMGLIVVVTALDISNIIIGEAVLSLLGLGVQEPWSSIGIMVSEAAGYIDADPFQVIPPSVMLALLVVAFSFIGNGLRDAFDTKHL